jgi:branched-subunit amino acid aminotransferase/4-amino-4-deoxychorismate lyase
MAVDGVIVAAAAEGMTGLPAGPGVFETLLVQAGAPVFLEDHWTRFASGCRWYGLDLPTTAQEVDRLALILGEENKVRTGVLRFAAWQSGQRVAWRVEVGPPRAHMARSEFLVGLGAALPPATPDRPFKHMNRGPWLEALRAARSAGWDEAILPDQAGRIVEGCVSNVFFVRAGCLHTPSAEVGLLPGIMRGRVLALARAMDLPVREGIYAYADLEQASELWFSNSLIGLRAASSLDGRRLAGMMPVLQQLRTGWSREYGWDPVVVVTPS